MATAPTPIHAEKPAAAAAEAPAAAAPASAPPGTKKPLVLIIAAVALLAGLGGGAWFLVPRVFGKGAPAEVREEPVKATVSLGSIIVNLSGESRRYVKAGVSLGLPGAKEAKEIEEARAQLLDLCISVLSSADIDTLSSEEGRDDLKEILLGRIHEELGLAHVSRVYFTEFVIQ